MAIEITKMFVERALFCPDFATFEQAHMTLYLSILKTDICRFVSTRRRGTLVELQVAARRLEIKMEL